MEIQSLRISERIILAEALWDSVVAEGSEVELDRRLQAFEIDQDRVQGQRIIVMAVFHARKDPTSWAGRI